MRSRPPPRQVRDDHDLRVDEAYYWTWSKEIVQLLLADIVRRLTHDIRNVVFAVLMEAGAVAAAGGSPLRRQPQLTRYASAFAEVPATEPPDRAHAKCTDPKPFSEEGSAGPPARASRRSMSVSRRMKTAASACCIGLPNR